ncbi:MAG: hypothetical protein HUU60_12180 [Armatimonadetes bacterium]|nr:hypothetical protein [Armatimonadota bacterium]
MGHFGASRRLDWFATVDGPGGKGLVFTKVLTSVTGMIYVMGELGVGSNQDYYVAKFDPTGTQSPVWSRTFNGSNDLMDSPRAMVLDASGNVYVTGVSFVSATDANIVTIKYANSDGSTVWSATYDGAAIDDIDQAYDMAIDGVRNTYIAGSSPRRGQGGSPVGRDLIVLRYDMNGQPHDQWPETDAEFEGERRWSNPNFDGIDEGFAIALGSIPQIDLPPISYVVVSGQTQQSSTNQDWATVLWEIETGDQRWFKTYSSISKRFINHSNTDRAFSVAADASGYLLVYGNVGGAQQFPGVTGAAKYRAIDGLVCWAGEVCLLSGTTAVGQNAVAAKLDGRGALVTVNRALDNESTIEGQNMIASRWKVSLGIVDCPTMGESGLGVCTEGEDEYLVQHGPEWIRQYDRSATNNNDEEIATGLAIDPMGRIAVGGYERTGSGASDLIGIHYSRRFPYGQSEEVNEGCTYFRRSVSDNKVEARAATTQPWGNFIAAGREGPESSPKGFVGRFCWLIGDVNGDEIVDDADLAIILENFGQPASNKCDPRDIDENGEIDDGDLAAVLTHFGRQCNP